MNIRKTGLFLFAGLASALLILIFVDPFGTSQAAGDNRQPKNSKITKQQRPANFDALAASPMQTESVSQQMEGGRRVQTEPRFGVPTFLWASDPGSAHSMRRSAADRTADQVSAARSHLGTYADRYRLKKADLLGIRVSSVHDTGSGAIIVKFKQDLGGIEVFRDEINVIMNRNLQLIALSGYLTGDNTADTTAAGNFGLQPEDALSKAIEDLTGSPVDPSLFQRINNKTIKSRGPQVSDPYLHFTVDQKAFSGLVFSDEPSRTKQVMFHLPGGYVPAYYVETSISVPSTASTILTISSEPANEELAYGYVISAVDGQILFRKNLIAEQTNMYRVWADPVTKIPYDTPAGNDVHPKVSALPDGIQYPFLAQQDVSLQSFPFSHNDPWLPAGATETSGNNADAFVDLTTPDGFGPIAAAPYDGTTSTGDFRAQNTAPGQFLHIHVADVSPATAEARQGAIQQLFYNVNFLHDWFYDAGFNEVSGNAQTDNYGRGGLANDNIKAQAQDFASRNNANMLTPADGGRPRMRMYLFDTNAVRYVDVLSPAAAAGQRAVGTGQFGQQVFDVTNDIVQPNPADGCTAASFTGTAGKFVLVNRDVAATCSIGTKLNNAMAAGVTGFILVNSQSSPDTLVNVTGSLPTFTIPFLTITWNGAAAIKTQLAIPVTVSVRMRRDAGVDRDGTIDNQIVFHEWGHYISNRLIGNGSGLNTNMSGGMGEGWGDFNAMLALTVRENDTSVPSNATWNGAYALATYATSGGVNNGYYFGIRRVPYSTNMNIDPLTYKHTSEGQPLPVGPPIAFGASGVGNSEVHNTGEVWATMLWECYASLLRDTQGASPRLTFQQAQTRMKNYMVAAYKMTPISPTFLEARDAVLAAAFANDTTDGILFGQAFAKRGAGVRAVSPDRFSSNNVGVVESYVTGADITFVDAVLDDSILSHDNDGYLDSGETGVLTFRIKNSGMAPLLATTSQITSDNANITFPNGNSVNFPAVQPFATAIATVRVHSQNQNGLQTPTFTITSNDPGISDGSQNLIPSPVVGTYTTYAAANETPASSRTDSVEARQTPWVITNNPNPVLNQTAAARFSRQAQVPFNYKWFVPDVGNGSDQYLTSPVMTVDGSGSVNMQFDHSWGFEFDAGGNYDGGVIEMSVNGGAFADIGASAYNGTILSYAGDVNPLAGRPGFVQNSAGTVHTSLTQAVAAGSTVQIRFRAASDGGVGAAGWLIDNIAFTGIVETPFTVLVPDLSAPTSASVSGRVTTAIGFGIPRAVVTMTDNAGGPARTTTSNSFGYYHFDGVTLAHTYTFQATARRYTFTPHIVTVNDVVDNLDFIP